MNKLIDIGSQDDLLKQLGGQLSMFFEAGDRHVKTAASSAFSRDLILANMPDSKHFGIHQIALGAGPWYTFNKNGDDYAEEDVKPKHDDWGHHTFVKHGHYYREHRNTDPKLKIGDIKAAAYNDKMHRVELIIHGDKSKAEDIYESVKQGKQRSGSMSCFPAGTMVWMANGSNRPIEQVQEGDAVLTHHGNIGLVTTVMWRDYTGKGIELHVPGLAKPIVCTADHKIWVRPCADYAVEGFVEAEKLQAGDFVRQVLATYNPAAVELADSGQAFLEDGFLYCKLQKVEAIELNVRVYDLTVPGDHGFVVHGIGVSNCRVKYDVCSCCDNKAKSSANYCPHLKYSMTRWLPQFSKFAYAKNPHPKFFDYSDVANPADRIAHSLETFGLEKQSSVAFPFSDQLAEAAGIKDLVIPSLGCASPRHQHMLEKLAGVEAYLEQSAANQAGHDERAAFAKLAANCSYTTEVADEDVQAARQLEPDVFFYYLAKRASVLPFGMFWSYVQGTPLVALSKSAAFQYAQNGLPRIFRRLQDAAAEEKLEHLFEASDSIKAAVANCDLPVLGLMDRLAAPGTLNKSAARIRFLSTSFSTPLNKGETKVASTISDSEKIEAEQMLRCYAHYKVAAALDFEELHGAELFDDPTQILLVSTK